MAVGNIHRLLCTNSEIAVECLVHVCQQLTTTQKSEAVRLLSLAMSDHSLRKDSQQ